MELTQPFHLVGKLKLKNNVVVLGGGGGDCVVGDSWWGVLQPLL
jgi:hypothetical protein